MELPSNIRKNAVDPPALPAAIGAASCTGIVTGGGPGFATTVKFCNTPILSVCSS